MKLKIGQKQLKTELFYLTRIAEAKSTIPILQSVHLEAKDNQLIISASNLDITLRVFLEAEVSEAESVCVNARDLKRITDVCGDEIEISVEHEKLQIKSEDSVWNLETTPPENFVVIPDFIKGTIEMPFDKWKSAINLVKFAITKEQSRFTLSGAKLLMSKDDLTLATTDGHRLALFEQHKKKDSRSKIEIDGILHLDALSLMEIIKDKDAVIHIHQTPSHYFHFEIGNRQITVRALGGVFPQYEMVLPKDNPHSATFEIKVLQRALKQALIIQPSYRSGKQIAWTFDQDGVSTIQSRSEGDSFQTSILTFHDGAGITLGFNPNYLLDLCRVLKTGMCKMSFKDNAAQVEFEAMEESQESRFRYVVMPLRI